MVKSINGNIKSNISWKDNTVREFFEELPTKRQEVLDILNGNVHGVKFTSATDNEMRNSSPRISYNTWSYFIGDTVFHLDHGNGIIIGIYPDENRLECKMVNPLTNKVLADSVSKFIPEKVIINKTPNLISYIGDRTTCEASFFSTSIYRTKVLEHYRLNHIKVYHKDFGIGLLMGVRKSIIFDEIKVLFRNVPVKEDPKLRVISKKIEKIKTIEASAERIFVFDE